MPVTPLIPRALVHEWSETIGAQASTEQSNLTRIMKDNRRLSRFVEENFESLDEATRSVAMYLVGVVARIYEKAGGRMRIATWDQLRAATAKVEGQIGALLPLDDGFVARCHALTDRAQPHIVDEAVYALFERPSRPDEAQTPATERLKLLLLMWVANEVCAVNWTPPATFKGEASYTHTPVEDAL